MLATAPGGYCLFTPQGLFRETQRAAQVLGVEKIAHAEDIVAALKDAASFYEPFRKLQQIGQPFTIMAETTGDKRIQIIGKRFRVGREGPLVDAVWFEDSLVAAETLNKQKTELSLAHKRATETKDLLDLIPFPVWTRGKDLNLTLCNTAYAKALDVSPNDVIKSQHELESQTARGGSGRTFAANAP